MARTFSHFATAADGQQVGYAYFRRATWAVLFTGPSGRRVERTTGAEVRGAKPGPDFHAEAVRIIQAAYTPADNLFTLRQSPTWDTLLDEVERQFPGIRPETMRSYRAASKAFVTTLPDVASPCHVSEDRVERFAHAWLAAPKTDGTRRSPVTLSYHMRALSSFSNHLIKLTVLTKGKNLFRGYVVPAGERSAKKGCPTEDQVGQFFDYVNTRYPTWQTLRTLLTLKAVSACRTADLCQLRTADLTATGITFTAASSKTKTARVLPLSADLAAEVRSGAGPVWIWEQLFHDIKKYRKQSNGIPAVFSRKTIEFVLINIFREYSDAHPDQPRLTPHAFRRRGITVAVKAMGGNIEAAASAIGVHPQTAARHYLDDKEAYQTAETMRRLADVLAPKFKSKP